MLVDTGDARILIDCGLGVRTLAPLMQSVGAHLKDLNAIMITHEHTDHMRGLERVLPHARSAAVYATDGTLSGVEPVVPARTTMYVVGEDAFEIGPVVVQAIPTPHDANEPCAYHLTIGEHRLLVATDMGEVTPEIAAALQSSTVAVFESNHDEVMLANGSYPEILKRRIRSNLGHLSNRQCAAALTDTVDTELSTIILAHLSDENNHPDVARASAESVLNGRGCDLHVTRQGVTGPYLNFSSNIHLKGQSTCEPLPLFR